MRVLRRGAWVSLVVALLLPGGRAPAQVALPRLHTDGPHVVDPADRVVLLRGFNASQKTSPYVPSWLGDTDADRIAELGANVVRLGVEWAGAEPTRGMYSTDWLAALKDVIGRLNARGVYVILDMHQDFWSEKYGGDGAPSWANWSALPGGPSAGPADPRVSLEFARFWTNGDGIQDDFINMWVWLADNLGDNPGVVGFDFMNEPHPGIFPPGTFEQGFLIPFYRRIIDAVRDEDVAPQTIVFVEPPVWTDIGVPSVLAPLGRDNVVYAPHLYPWLTFSWFTPVVYPGHPATITSEYVARGAEATVLGAPLWVGEWGLVEEAVNAEAYVRDGARLHEQFMVGSAWWEYAGPRPDRFSPVNSDEQRTLKPHAVPLVRPFPRAIGGAPVRFGFDDATGRFALTVADPVGTTTISAPALRYPDASGPLVTCSPDPCASVAFDGTHHTVDVAFGGSGEQTVELSPRP